MKWLWVEGRGLWGGEIVIPFGGVIAKHVIALNYVYGKQNLWCIAIV